MVNLYIKTLSDPPLARQKEL